MQEIELMQVYELGFHIVPTIAEEKVANVFGDIKSLLEKNGAVFISEEYPKMRPLAYAMLKNEAGKNEKFNFAYFGWVKYELPKEAAAEVKNKLEKNKEILRFLVIKTVRENTLYGHKLPRKDNEKPEAIVAADVPVEEIIMATEEEIDKTIEELVVE
jgi:ribosomal protein S6